jgi:TfoX/Sxy family transcriptional regulator of competence genes
MEYDEALAQRVRTALNGVGRLSERKLFGGVGFIVNGNLACGVSGTTLFVRMSPEQFEAALVRPFVRPLDTTGRAMKGWIVVDPQGVQSTGDLKRWIDQAVSFAQSLSPN